MTQFEDKPQRRADDQARNHTCSYETNGLRCRYPGGNSHSILGGGPFYCSVHFREGGTRFARQCLEASQDYRAPVDDPNSLEKLTWLAENFPMQAGESHGEYNMRCKAYALSMLKGFKPKPMVSTEPQRMREPGEDLVEF